MKKVLYGQYNKKELEKHLNKLGVEKQPKVYRWNMYPKIKLYKITIEVEEVPEDELEYHLTNEDVQKKYTEKEIKAGIDLYRLHPLKTMRSDDSYSMWEDTMDWHELSPKHKENYIKGAM